ncbi:MAG: MerR family transcriptional regulator [Bacillota bacterium]|nr:MerR family transcriptional regulator [Bacillota bacterium]
MLVRLHNPEEPVYVISVASRLLGVSPHFLRMLEREGILEPARTEKNIRLYSETELLFLRRVCHLIHEERINIPGVKAILRLEMTEASFGKIERRRVADGPAGSQDQDETEAETGPETGPERRPQHNDPAGSTRKWR